MKITIRSSRRAFVLGGGAAAICAGPLAAAAPQGEIAEWEALVGTRFRIGEAVAKLAAVERQARDPGRPLGLVRAQPFAVRFEIESGAAPAGQRTYPVAHPAKGAIDLFLGRGADLRGKPVLHALFN